jgi:hypothetical protein
MKKSLFLVFWVCLGLTAMAQITLKFNPDKGSKYEYQMEMIQKINQTIMGQKMDVNQTMILSYNMDVVEKTATETRLEMMYKDVSYNLVSAMMNMTYDSKSNATPANTIDEMMAKIFGSLLNKKFTVTLLPDGSVKSVAGMKEIINDMAKAVGNDMVSQQVTQQLSQQFSDDAMKSTFEQSFKIYPTKAIKPGDSWNVVQKTGAGGMNMDLNTTYNLKSADAGTAIADVTSTINGMGGQITGTQSGTIEFDVKTGLPMVSKMNQKASGKVSANGMEIPMDIDSQVNVTVKKL